MEGLKGLHQQIISDYRQGRIALPSMPEVAFRLREAVRDERFNFDQLGKLVQLDPALSSRLIQIANSPRYRGSHKVDSCRDAISRLGISATSNLATSLALSNVFQTRQPRLQQAMKAAWQHGSRVAAVSHVLASVTPGLKPERAMLVGLVHNIGTLPLLRYLEAYPDLLERAGLVEQLLQRLQGKLGGLLLRHWGFSEEIAAVPEHAEDWFYDNGGKADYVDIVLVARVHALFGQPGAELPALQEMPSYSKLPISRFGADASIQLIEEANEEIGILMQMLQAK